MQSKIIRIGTRDSELALWQARTVAQQLEALGYTTTLVPVKSKGDVTLDIPLYEFGITGVFTKVLDVAMLKGEIDLAVHSMKDVPTQLPKGIVQTAVLPRGPFQDVMVLKDQADFLKANDSMATIATGSLRRTAFWKNRYPNHKIENLRGNVNTRLQKLEDNSWDGAIFAKAGLARINLLPENIVNLDWMLPAPAQGIVMVVAKEEDTFVREACSALNDSTAQYAAQVERDFLRKLEGGCTAPIGAYADIKDDQLYFQGTLLSLDGLKRVDVSGSCMLTQVQHFGEAMAEQLLTKGGDAIMRELKRSEHWKS